MSPDNRLLAFAVDTGGRRIYSIRIKDLVADKLLDDSIDLVTANLAWANDSRTLFYTKQDPNDAALLPDLSPQARRRPWP